MTIKVGSLIDNLIYDRLDLPTRKAIVNEDQPVSAARSKV